MEPKFGDLLIHARTPGEAENILKSNGYDDLHGEDVDSVLDAARMCLEAVQGENKFRQKQQTLSVDLVQDTLKNAARTYKTISWMSKILFSVGILLFVASAIYGAAFRVEPALLLGGLGALTFVTIFILRPIKLSQDALSNLVQVEISFMNYNEQIGMWQAYAMGSLRSPTGSGASLQWASDQLQLRSQPNDRVAREVCRSSLRFRNHTKSPGESWEVANHS